ncbi:Ff.00g118480.m01.CDS01 [Fusarium sp. VM40]|nr:Ff.00g118480.m01.CDS01 [Fusarium sp. VM40]
MNTSNTISAWPPVRVSIQSDNSYRTYNDEQNPQALFEKATRYLDSLKANYTKEQQNTLTRETNEAVIHAIFGSNMIERAGFDWEPTLLICRSVIRQNGEYMVDPYSDIGESWAGHSALRGKSRDELVRGHREVAQHMMAFQHIIHQFVIARGEMTEGLIKDTHAILCKNISIIDPEHPEVPWEKYAGKYRDVAVGAGNTMFIMPKFVPAKMVEMCAGLQRELEEGEATRGILDPFSLASKYSLKFVEIHPFQDGNGRMCRLILNAILLRYAGVIVAIGETEEDRVEYIDIKKRASRDMEGHGEYATFVLKKAGKGIQKLKQKLQGKRSS